MDTSSPMRIDVGENDSDGDYNDPHSKDRTGAEAAAGHTDIDDDHSESSLDGGKAKQGRRAKPRPKSRTKAASSQGPQTKISDYLGPHKSGNEETSADSGTREEAGGRTKKTTIRSGKKHQARAQEAAVKNAKQGAWCTKDKKVLVEKRRENLGWAAISRNHLPHKTPRACQGKWNRMKKGPDGHPVVESDESSSEEGVVQRDTAPHDTGDARPEGTGPRSSPEQEPPVQSSSAMTAGMVRMFSELGLGLRGENPYFLMLKSGDFSDYVQVTEDWQQAREAKRHIKQPHFLPFSIISALSWNDERSQLNDAEEVVGQFRCDWPHGDTPLVYLADRAWTPAEQQRWNNAAPRQRMHWTGAYIGWLWRDPETRVLPILPVASHKEEETGDPVFEIAVPFQMWTDIVNGQDVGPLVVSTEPQRTVFTSIQSLIRCKSGELAFGSCEGPDPDSRTKIVKVTWKLSATGNALSVWKDDQVLDTSSPTYRRNLIERMLHYHRLLREGQGQGEGIGLREWGDVMEDVMKGD